MMETLKLNFDAIVNGNYNSFTIEIPYRDGIVATSEFCPTQLLEGNVKLIAALRGDTLDNFLLNCRMQLSAISKIYNADSELDCHIGGLMAVVMDKFAANKRLSYSELLTCLDCFSLILKGRGVTNEEIREIYPKVADTILNLYPDLVDGFSA